MYLIGLDSRYYRCIQRLLSRGWRSSTRRSRSSTWPPSSAPSGSPSSTTKPSADCCPAPTPSRPETRCLYAGQRIIYNAQSEKPEGDFFDAGKLHCGQGRHNAQSLPARTPNLTRTNSYRSTIVAGQGQPLQAREALTTARDAYQHSSYRLGTQLPL